jgi:hypothetical protein
MNITIDEISNGKNELYDMVRKFGITDLRLSETEKLIRSACLTEKEISVCQYRGITFHEEGDFPTFWEAVVIVTDHNEKMSKLYYEFRKIMEEYRLTK